jgi:hypothetical protein
MGEINCFLMRRDLFPPPPDKVEYYDFYYSPKMAEHADIQPDVWPYVNYFNGTRYTLAIKTGQEAKCTWHDLVRLGTGTMKECEHKLRYSPIPFQSLL